MMSNVNTLTLLERALHQVGALLIQGEDGEVHVGCEEGQHPNTNGMSLGQRDRLHREFQAALKALGAERDLFRVAQNNLASDYKPVQARISTQRARDALNRFNQVHGEDVENEYSDIQLSKRNIKILIDETNILTGELFGDPIPAKKGCCQKTWDLTKGIAAKAAGLVKEYYIPAIGILFFGLYLHSEAAAAK